MGFESLSIVTYTAWKFWILKDRWDKTFNLPNHKAFFALELFYTILMLYLLLSVSTVFLFLAILSIVLHVLFGGYVELFRPEIALEYNDNIMTNYWQYVMLDSVVTIMSFAIITGVNHG